MRCLVAGTPEVAVVALRSILESGHEVVGVLTRPDARSGRGRRFTRSPMATAAAEHGIPVFAPERLTDVEFIETLTQVQPDCCPVIAYGGLIPTPLLDLPRYGWINLHFSLLPAWRGAAPVNHAILAGDTVTGVTTFRIDAGLDTGPILQQREYPIAATDTAGSLLAALAEVGAGVLVDTLNELSAGTLRPLAQPDQGASSAPRLRPEQARIDWQQPSGVVDRLVRAMTPSPGAWTQVHGMDRDPVRVGIAPLGLANPPALQSLTPGRITTVGEAVWVGTGDAAVQLTQVQPAGKRWMSAGDWLRGWRGDIPQLG